jgi:hypothetical protein
MRRIILASTALLLALSGGTITAVAQQPPDPRAAHWSFRPVKRPALPEVRNTAWPRNDLDRFILSRLEREGLAPSPEADRVSWLRRAHFNVTGLPPTPEQVKAFVEDASPDAHARVVDALLASPRYGERWAQHWLDVVRYADTHGFEVNTPRDHAWRYRDYVIAAFNDDKPYDRFVVEQLAGDALGADAATGFMVASPVLLPGQIGADDVSKRLARQDALDEIIVGTGGTMLGLTIGCARCHDHKFDPISARDYYGMQAFFAGVEYGDRAIDTPGHRERLAQAAALAPRIEQIQAELRRFELTAFAGRTLVIDETDAARATPLKPANGPGANPAGTKPGYRDDPGAADRTGNISRGQYTWWNNVPGEDVLAYTPGAAGRFRLWISWGAHGSGVHTRDAHYLLDADGDLATRGDQRELAKVDQYYLAGTTTGETEQTPLWSGLLDLGVVELTESAKIVVRGGDTGTGITADVIVLQEVIDGATATSSPSPALPRLREPVSPVQNVERFAAVAARFVRFTTRETIDDNLHEPCLDELEVFAAADPTTNVARADAGAVATSSGNYSETGIHQLAHVNDGRYGNDWSWISSERGGGWVQVELPTVVEIDRVVWGRDRDGKFPDRLPVRYEIAVSVDGQAWQTVAGHADRMPAGAPHEPVQTLLRNLPADATADLPALAAELSQLQAEKVKLEAPDMVFGGTFRAPDQTFVLRRGDPEQPTDPIGPAIPAVFDTAPALDGGAPAADTQSDERARRLALARWIASPDNPLTARVIVNRIWQYHFGTGLVETPNDFGLNGTQPSHPELLDWLAAEFVASGWSVKHVQQLILLSATYRQSSRIEPTAAALDRDTRLLWRFPPRRLEAEPMRDSVLAVSGELNLAMGGPGYSFFKSRGGLDGFPPVEKFGPEELRRMVYAHKVRREPVPVFGAFDCPDNGQAMPRRNQSTTALQALSLFNSAFIADRARAFADRVTRMAGERAEDQVTAAFELAYGRAPDAAELAASSAVVRQHGLAPLCRVIFNSNEFLFVP